LENIKLENREYYDRLYSFAKKFVSTQMKPFTIDDLRNDFLRFNPKPSNMAYFGTAISELSKNKLIKYNEKMVKSKAKGNRGRMIKEWISIQYSEKQSKKRLSEETAKARELAKQQTNLF